MQLEAFFTEDAKLEVLTPAIGGDAHEHMSKPFLGTDSTGFVRILECPWARRPDWGQRAYRLDRCAPSVGAIAAALKSW